MGDPGIKEQDKLIPGDQLDPMVRKFYLPVPPPNLRDNRGDVDRVLHVLEKSAGIRDPFVSLPVVGRISQVLHASQFKMTLTLACSRRGWEVIDVESGNASTANWGMAVDLGSTNIAFYLLDLCQGIVVEQSSVENPQLVHGEDILSRIHQCQDPQGLRTLQQLTAEALNAEVKAILTRHGIEQKHLYAFSVAGNTTMGHLLLGLSPLSICREPYVPVINRPNICRARDLGLVGNDNAFLYVLPNVGSYVGGDVLAGILVSGMHQVDDVSVLVDVGTNAEIVLGNRQWLMVAAGAAGPALEGGVVKCGMRAAHGAIEEVRIDRKTLRPSYKTIGGVAPMGICGSGLIDLVAELFMSRAIDERGKIVADNEYVVESDGVPAYRVAASEESGTGKALVLSELDINNLLRTKGAMYTALTVITRNAGVNFHELKNFYVAGTFGAYIDPRMAAIIGMVPDIPLDRYKALRNSAGAGACLCLFYNSKREELDHICEKITYVELNVNGDFMNLLTAAMFLPHTDRAQFPSVPVHNEKADT
jgi:uncharacterized 2Fe-2S/4Fe-4S cluster protein (DUF4445 family)